MTIHQFTFIEIFIYLLYFRIEIIQPFLNLDGAPKYISQHHQKDYDKNSWIGENELMSRTRYLSVITFDYFGIGCWIW